MKRLLSALGAVVAVSTATVMVTPAAPALACGNAVIESMPLIDSFTGQASWNYGYVQLWYDYCNGDNWGRTVAGSKLDATLIVSMVYNTNRNTNINHSTPPSATSGTIYSPSYAAGAYGVVYIADSNDSYYAEADQSGANCAQDYNGNQDDPCPR